MLFLLALPVICCVALLWRYLQIYAPSNMLIRRVRSAPPRWRTVVFLLALSTVLLVAMHLASEAIGRGAPGWLNLVVLILAWNAIKFTLISVRVALLTSWATARSVVHRGRPAAAHPLESSDARDAAALGSDWPCWADPRRV